MAMSGVPETALVRTSKISVIERWNPHLFELGYYLILGKKTFMPPHFIPL
jgi:hypothetical protein